MLLCLCLYGEGCTGNVLNSSHFFVCEQIGDTQLRAEDDGEEKSNGEDKNPTGKIKPVSLLYR